MFPIEFFFHNTIWYVLLGVTTIIELTVMLKKSKNRIKLVNLFFIFYGLTLLVEMFLYIYLRAYEYFPMVFLTDSFNDSLFGNLFSQASVAATALLIAFFDLNLLWQLLIASLYFLVETAFLALGIYQHHWYQTWITFVGLFPAFWLFKKIYKLYYGVYGKIFIFLCVFLGFYSLYYVLFNWSFFIAPGIIMYNTSILQDPNESWITVGTFISFTTFGLGCWAYAAKKWVWKMPLFLLEFLVFFAAFKFHQLLVKPGWLIAYALISIAASYATVVFLNKYIKQPVLAKPATTTK